MLDTAQGGLLKSVHHLLSEIFIPVIKTMNQGWVKLVVLSKQLIFGRTSLVPLRDLLVSCQELSRV